MGNKVPMCQLHCTYHFPRNYLPALASIALLNFRLIAKVSHPALDRCVESDFREWGITLPTQRIITICSPDHVKHVMKSNPDIYIKGEKFHDTFRELLVSALVHPTLITPTQLPSYLGYSTLFSLPLRKLVTEFNQHRFDSKCHALISSVGNDG